jgi:cysteine desulfurase
MKSNYFDWASTTPMSPASLESYLEAAREYYGNASSIHRIGKASSAKLSSIRDDMADLIGVASSHLYFTGSGTEANGLVCDHFLRRKSSSHIILSGIEHPSVYEYYTAFKEAGHHITVIDAPEGVVSTRKVEKSIREDTSLILVMSVNNVLGTIQKLDTIREAIDTSGFDIHLHTDAVQAFGKIPFETYLPFVDSFSASAHKIQGPKGTGLLYCRKPITVVSSGGGQEHGLRPGTEDLPSLAAFRTAAADYCTNMSEYHTYVEKLKQRLIDRIIFDGSPIRLLTGRESSPYILPVTVEGIPSEVFVRVLDDQGFCLSTGSACSSKSRKKIERVLRRAHFTSAQCASAIRISLSPLISEKMIDELGDTMIQQAKQLGRALGINRK